MSLESLFVIQGGGNSPLSSRLQFHTCNLTINDYLVVQKIFFNIPELEMQPVFVLEMEME